MTRLASITGTLRSRLPPSWKARARPLLQRLRVIPPATEWWHPEQAPWDRRPGDAARWCPVCAWTGDEFVGVRHVELLLCPQCGASGRDRYLIWCFLSRTPDPGWKRVIETSPRLGREYRDLMRSWFDYTASDFDESAHIGDIRLDLQQIDLADDAVDVVLTPHVLEHVPETAKALGELRRVVAPGGVVYLQVPLLQGVTAPPDTPEFHGDNTPVFWRFGWDLTDQLVEAGFDVDVLVPQEFFEMLSTTGVHQDDAGEFLLSSIVPHPNPSSLTVVADTALTHHLGFEPAYQYAVWECRVPAA